MSALPAMAVTGHYSARNIYSIREWAIARLAAEPDDARLQTIEGWCRAWLENDPREGGDPSVRRELRGEWSTIFTDFRRMAG